MYSILDLDDWAKNIIPYSIFILLPLLLIISPTAVSASTEFPAFRLHQYDLHGSVLGSRTSLVNVEARSLGASSFARKCVVLKLTALNSQVYKNIIDQGAAAMLIILPREYADLTTAELEIVRELENTMLSMETEMAVYFTHETKDVLGIYNSVQAYSNSDKASSAAGALLTSLTSDAYQMVISGSASKAVADASMSNVFGRLSGYGVEEELPTIVIVAHYDAFGAAPELSFGADSNGSGVIALLEIARVLSKLYSSQRTKPKMNIVFLLSAGSYANYQGSKRFLEDQLDATDSQILSELQFAVCLDTIANGDSLNMHVSKKPKEDAPSHSFFEALSSIGNQHNVPVNMVHKKINLQNDQQSWEHEKYSLRRLPAFTVSRLESAKTGERGSITDDFNRLDKKKLARHISIILHAIQMQIYNGSVESMPQDTLSVTETSIEAWISLLSAQPRSSQLLLNKDNSFVTALKQSLSRYIEDVEVSHFKADKRDPDWVFYDVTSSVMTAYAIKPATFDFFLCLLIVAYLAAIHQFIQFFPVIVSHWSSATASTFKMM